MAELKLNAIEENKQRIANAVRTSTAKKKKRLEQLKTDRLTKSEYQERAKAIINEPIAVMEQYVMPGRAMSPNKIVTSKEWLQRVAEIRTEFLGEPFKPQQHLKLHQYIDALYSSQSGYDMGYMHLMYFANTKALNPLGETKFDSVDVSLSAQRAIKSKDQLYEFAHSQRTMYHTLATFNGIQRKKEGVRQMHACYVDIDCYKEGLSQQEVIEAIFWHVKRGDIPMPSFIVSSGRGIYVIFLISDVPGTSKSIRFYDLIQSELVEVFSQYGADHKAKSVNGYLRLPGTLNPKANKKVEILFYDLDARYEMRQLGEHFALSDLMDSKVEVLPKTVKKAPKKLVKSKGKGHFTHESYQSLFRQELLTLLMLRGYEMEGYRDTWLYMMHHSLLRSGLDESTVMDKLYAYNNRFKSPLPESEIDSLVKSSRDRYEEWAEERRHIENGERSESTKGYKMKGYNWKTTKVIKLLGITEDEMAHLKLFASQGIKEQRKKQRQQVYNEQRRSLRRKKNDGLTTREFAKQKNIDAIKALFQQGLKQIEIATRLGLTKGYVSQIVRKIKSENN